jgi:hypothetical protein
MSDTTAEPITLEAFHPGDLLLDANARTNVEATVTKADQRKRNSVKRWRTVVALICSVGCDLGVLATAGGGCSLAGVGGLTLGHG